MEKIKTYIIRIITLLALLLSFTTVSASDFLLTVQNLQQTADNKLEFDIYMQNTRTSPLTYELATLQFGFLLNSLIYTGGTITATISNTGSGLVSGQQFTANPNTATKIGNQTVIKLAGRTPVGTGNGTLISATAPGTLVTHFILTSSVSFTPNSTPDLTFISSTATIPYYVTSTSEYINNVNTILSVTSGVDAIVNGNPVLNANPYITITTPASTCGTGTVTLGAMASVGTINWYAALTGGASLGTGTSFTTPSLSSTTTYYVDATYNSITSPTRTAITATVNDIPTITGTTPASICGTGTVVLGATASAGTINWYSAASGGTSLGTGTSFTTPSISSSTIYYVDATNNGCTTTSRTSVLATINTIPTIIGVTPNSICSTGTVVLGATASAGTINWYAALTGGASLGTGTSYTTPSISSSTTYYVDATNGTCTTASRTSVLATINSTPTITGVTPNSRCGTGTVVLGATSSAGTINWYTALTGGASLATGASYTTPSISSSTTYYVDATIGTCTTASRTSVLATINSTPTITGVTPNSRCGTGTVVLAATASAGATINWYAALTGGASLATGTSYTTPSIAASKTYYVSATNACGTSTPRTSVLATINTIPTILSVTPNNICGTGTVTLGATASAGTINWYAALTGGASLATGASYTTPSISSSTTYYVDATSGTCTTTSRTSVLATINTIPSITGVTPNNRCGTGTVALGATASAGTINWYAALTGGASLGTGVSYTTPSISSSTIYYVDATSGTCTTASRTSVLATINTIPTITGVTPNSICGTGTVTLGATASAGTINWYAALTGGASLGTGTNYTTPSISSNTTYYVDATNSCGTTASRTSVLATVNIIPILSSTLTPTAICSGSPFNYTATSATGGATFSWTRATVAGISNTLGSGASATINEILTNTTNTPIIVTYAVTTTANTCPNTQNVTVTVNPTPSITTISSPTACSGTAFSFTPVNSTDGIIPTGTTYSWSSPSVTGGITGGASGSGSNSIIGTLTNPATSTQTATYTVTPLAGTCTGSTFIVSATVNPIPTVTVADGNTCSGGTVSFNAVSNITGSTFNWYQTAVSSPVLGTNAIYTTPALTSNTDYYVAATANGCTSFGRTKTTALISGSNTAWAGTSSNNWNDYANWTHGVPCANSDVTIPDVSTSGVGYPTITGSASCKNIIFEAGAAVLGLQYLSYNKAFVRTELQRSKWYTLTAPLKEMFAGDYAFSGGSPVTQMRLFDEINPDSINIGALNTGTWSKGFSTPLVALTPGSGFAYYVDTKTYNYPGAITYLTTNITNTFPRINPDSSLVTSYFPYSTFSGRLLTPAWIATKNPSLAYRFAMENSSNVLVNTTYTLKPGINLIGNPLMTHLDFNKLYADNAGVINNKVKFWNGTTFTTYMAGSTLDNAISSSDNTTNIIPPMQAFFVESPSGGSLTFNLNNDFVANNSMNLKSASIKPNILYIETDNGSFKSSTAIAQRDSSSNNFDANDAFKLFSQFKHVPEVYTLAGGVPLDINQFEVFPYTVPLCIKTDSGTVAFKFVGAESFDSDVDVSLINTSTGEEQNLKNNNSYSFTYNGTNGVGTLYLSFRKANIITESTNKTADSNIQIFSRDKTTIRIVSTPTDLIKSITVYDETGKIIASERDLETFSQDMTLQQNLLLCLVKVTTESNVKVSKIIMK